MTTERWLFDGWDLESSGVRGWEYRDGTGQVASTVGANGAVPNRTGEIWRPKALGAGVFTLNLWWAGLDQAAVNDQFRLILRAAVRPHRLVHVQRYLPNGEIIECDVEYAGSIKPTYIAQRGMKAAIDFKIPSGVWKGSTLFTGSTVAGGALPQTLVLPQLAKSTAAIEDANFLIYGPITSPIVVDRTDGVDGDYFQYDTTIAAGDWIVVNSKAWAVSGGGGHVVNQGAIIATGRRFLTIPAARPDETPTVQLRGSNGGGTTKLELSAHATFAC